MITPGVRGRKVFSLSRARPETIIIANIDKACAWIGNAKMAYMGVGAEDDCTLGRCLAFVSDLICRGCLFWAYVGDGTLFRF